MKMSIASLPMVTMVQGQPLASSVALAEGLRMPHASVIKLIRRHRANMERFGRVGFEIQPFATQGGEQRREFALLNEHQATLLISMMRNTPLVIECKVRLVEEFFCMRDALAKREQGMWQQMQALIAREVDSKVRASFGSHLMNERKRQMPQLHMQIQALQEEMQPMLPLFH